MKTIIKHIQGSKTLAIISAVAIMATGCQREDGDLVPATFPNTAEVFTDTFSGGLDYAAYGNSKKTAFDLDTDVAYQGTASMRFEVPDTGDPEGGYAGGIIATSGGRDGLELIVAGGRDLSGYNAMTFWAKSSMPSVIGTVGFGTDFSDNKYVTSISDAPVNSNWAKYYVPIPDPSLLTQEKGMFFISVDPVEGQGYTLWVDEVKFENSDQIGAGVGLIENGADLEVKGVNGQSVTFTATSVFSVEVVEGVFEDIIVNTANAYFTFSSSNTNAVSISGGVVEVIGDGQSTITAQLGGMDARGSLVVTSLGDFSPAPEPTKAEADVVSVFSDVYANVPVDHYNGYWGGFQTTTSADFTVNGNNVLNYENFNYVGIESHIRVSPIDATGMTNFHADMYIVGNIPGGARFNVVIKDLGSDGVSGGGDDQEITSSYTSTSSPALVTGQWITLDMDLSALTNKSSIWQIVLTSDGGNPVSAFYFDNLYFYK